MFYVLTDGSGGVVSYPYTLNELKLANTGTSFPKVVTDEIAADFNCFPVKAISKIFGLEGSADPRSL